MSDHIVRSLAMAVTLLIGIPWVVLVMIPLFVLPVLFMFGIPIYFIQEFFFKGKRKAPVGLTRALVVDDDESSIINLVSILEEKSVKVDIAESGEAMVKKLAENDYDVLFVDRLMPEQTGDIALAIADDQVSKNKVTPVVFFTGADTAFRVPKLFNFDVLGIWVKQVAYKTLEHQVDDLLENINEEAV